jgi:transposase
MGDDTTSVTAALFGLTGFEILAAAEVSGELELLVQTVADLVGCPVCGAVARAKDRRRPTWVRDLPLAGRPVMICWVKRIWCCPHPLCEQRTWTEQHPAIAPRAGMTERARVWAFEQVAGSDAALSRIATGLGVVWWTIMRQVIDRGTLQVEDPDRLAGVSAVGVDETAYLRASSCRSTTFATGIADLTRVVRRGCWDVVEGRSGTVLAAWPDDRDQAWRARITIASLDPFRGYATALSNQLPGAVRVLDPFHVVRLALTVVDDLRRSFSLWQTTTEASRSITSPGSSRAAARADGNGSLDSSARCAQTTVRAAPRACATAPSCTVSSRSSSRQHVESDATGPNSSA